MNISKIFTARNCRFLSKYRHVATAAATDAEIEVLRKQPPKVTTNLSGISIASVEDYSPITQISVLVKAGSRQEGPKNQGIAHCLRNCTALSSKESTAFTLIRNIELCGGKLLVSSAREYLIYTLQCIRDHIDTTLPILAELCNRQSFHSWEVDDSNPRLQYDLACLNANPDLVLMEALHKIAFRGGLSNSLYSPAFMIGKHSVEMLEEYIQNHFTTEKTVVAGVGIDHDYLETKVTELMQLVPGGGKPQEPSKFGGGEVRIEGDQPVTRAAIVAEGASIAKTKEVLSLGILQCILGLGPQLKHSHGEHSKLGAAAAKATSHPYAVSSLNVSYSDTGIFGVYVAGQPNDMKEIVKSVVTQMRETTKKLSDADIAAAKHALKAKLLLDIETSQDKVENMAIQVSSLGRLRNAEELGKEIDSLTPTDINAVTSKVMKTKPAMVALGPLHNTPYLDELL